MTGLILTIISKCGVPCKVLVPIPKKTKLGYKMMNCIFIGCALYSSAYNFLIHKLEIPDIHVNMIIEPSDDMLFEDIFPYKWKEEKTYEKITHEIALRD